MDGTASTPCQPCCSNPVLAPSIDFCSSTLDLLARRSIPTSTIISPQSYSVRSSGLGIVLKGILPQKFTEPSRLTAFGSWLNFINGFFTPPALPQLSDRNYSGTFANYYPKDAFTV